MTHEDEERVQLGVPYADELHVSDLGALEVHVPDGRMVGGMLGEGRTMILECAVIVGAGGTKGRWSETSVVRSDGC